MTASGLSRLETLALTEEAIGLWTVDGHHYEGYVKSVLPDAVLLRGVRHQDTSNLPTVRSYYVVAAKVESFYLLAEENRRGPAQEAVPWRTSDRRTV